MKLLYKNLGKGEIKLKITNLADLWYLSHIIEKDDLVKGKTERKIKLGDDSERNKRIVRKPVTLTVKAEKIEFSAQQDILRVNGKISEGTDDIPAGSYHTIDITENSIIKIIKQKWFSFQLKKIEDALAGSREKIVIVVMDREEAYFALLEDRNYKILSHLKGDVQKKREDHEAKGGFYIILAKQLKEYLSKYNIKQAIVASPGFWKEYILNGLDEETRKKITLAGCSSVDKNAINEVLRRPELKNVLQKDKIRKELELVDKLMMNIAKENAAYGLKEVKQNIINGNLNVLLITDNYIIKTRKDGFYDEVDNTLAKADQIQSKIYIIETDEASQKLDSLGGIAGIQRWKTSN